VVALDIVPEKIEQLNRGKSPIVDAKIEDFLQNRKLNFTATLDKEGAYAGADYVIIATPTDYDTETNYFNTGLVEAVIWDVMEVNPNAVMLIKSTVPVGYTVRIRTEMECENLIFPPLPKFCERATHSTIIPTPSLIVVGEQTGRARIFANLLVEARKNQSPHFGSLSLIK